MDEEWKTDITAKWLCVVFYWLVGWPLRSKSESFCVVFFSSVFVCLCSRSFYCSVVRIESYTLCKKYIYKSPIIFKPNPRCERVCLRVCLCLCVCVCVRFISLSFFIYVRVYGYRCLFFNGRCEEPNKLHSISPDQFVRCVLWGACTYEPDFATETINSMPSCRKITCCSFYYITL